jgi:hypothetical protein
VGYIVVRALTRPDLAPATAIENKTGWARYELLVLYVLPLASIFVVVIGAMSAGFDRIGGPQRLRPWPSLPPIVRSISRTLCKLCAARSRSPA